MPFVEAFIFTVNALTIISRLAGLDAELQHEDDRHGASVSGTTHPSIPDSTLPSLEPRRKTQHNVNCESSE